MMSVLASKIPRLYFWLSFVWLLFGQTVLIARLWYVDDDIPTLFGSPRLADIYMRLEVALERAVEWRFLILPACGLVLLLALVISLRNYSLEQVSVRLTWVAGGLWFNALLLASLLAVKATMPGGDWSYYGPPPSAAQLAVALGLVAVGIVLLVFLLRQARRYQLNATGGQG
jgi:hypothetical protein